VNRKLEGGIELGFINDRILFTLSYFRNVSSNQLINYTMPVQTGFSSILENWSAVVENKGFEFQLNTKNISSRYFTWTSSFNLSAPRNKLLKFPNITTSSYANTYVVGQPLSVYGGFKSLGVDPQTGVYQFADATGKATFSPVYPTDYIHNLGNAEVKFYGGLQNNLTYKNWDFSFFFEFRKQPGRSILSQFASPPFPIPGTMNNVPVVALDRWTKPGDQTIIQKLTTTQVGNAASNAYFNVLLNYNSSNFYTDASFIRLKNMALSYDFSSLLKRAAIDHFKLYIQGQNLLTITKYVGADPENQNLFVLPPLRTIVAGLDINF
jgi:hypothetical protein